MTARDAFAQAVAAPPGERLHLFETVCVSRGPSPVALNTDDWGEVIASTKVSVAAANPVHCSTRCHSPHVVT